MQLGELWQRPRLIVLAACQTAAHAASSVTRAARRLQRRAAAAAGVSGRMSSPALTALGPRLADAGIAAVVAMQGAISMETAAELMPAFFTELARDGVIDRADGRGARPRPHAAGWLDARAVHAAAQRADVVVSDRIPHRVQPVGRARRRHRERPLHADSRPGHHRCAGRLAPRHRAADGRSLRLSDGRARNAKTCRRSRSSCRRSSRRPRCRGSCSGTCAARSCSATVTGCRPRWPTRRSRVSAATNSRCATNSCSKRSGVSVSRPSRTSLIGCSRACRFVSTSPPIPNSCWSRRWPKRAPAQRDLPLERGARGSAVDLRSAGGVERGWAPAVSREWERAPSRIQAGCAAAARLSTLRHARTAGIAGDHGG